MRLSALAWVLIFCGMASAEYLSDYEVPREEPPPSHAFSIGYTGRLFAGGVDHWATGGAQWRLDKHWAWLGELGLSPANSGMLAGVAGHWYPRGEIRTSEYEDFFHLGASVVGQDGGMTSLVSLGYGRDVVPWASASFGLRLGLRLEYAIAGDAFVRTSRGVLGIEESKLARTLLALEASLFLL